MIKCIQIFILGFCIIAQASGQTTLSPGTPVYQQVQAALQSLYETDIVETRQIAEQIRKQLPGHPVYPMLQALAIRAAYHPLDTDSKQFSRMREYLYDVAHRAEQMLEEDEHQPEANFFALAAYSLLATYENDDGNTLKAVSLAKEAYQYMKEGFELQDEYPEFYFSSGLYNYYREKYPELHPVYKSFAWLFRSGDIQQGLAQLKKASVESTVMKTEAKDYLGHIYLRYERQPDLAYQYARDLATNYPDNLYFVALYVDAALASGHYAGLEPYIAQLSASDRTYYQMIGQLFTAMLLEKKEENWDKAERYYIKSLTISDELKEDLIAHYKSLAYAGLARVALGREKPQQAEKFYEQALTSAQYPQTAQEAEEYLK